MEENKNLEVNEAKNAEPGKKEEQKKKGFLTEARIEMIVAIFLGITALLTAWATWIGSLHGGNQATNYTESNHKSSEGNSEYNSGMQDYLADLLAWNEMQNYKYDIEIAELHGETEEADIIQEKLDNFRNGSFSEIMLDGLDWLENGEGKDSGATSPFDKEGLVDRYFENGNALLNEADELFKKGQQDNMNGDKFGLVTVIYSLILFLLGIIGIFKRIPNRTVVLAIAIIGLICAAIYMFTIPMPTDFSISNYFGS